MGEGRRSGTGLWCKWEVRVDVFVFFSLCWSPESCNSAAALVRAGQGVLEGIAGLNVVVDWPSWCSRNQSPRLHRLSHRKDRI